MLQKCVHIHENILKHDKRPFNTAEEMNQKKFENLNIIQADSILLYGGDFVWGKNEMKYNLACEAKKKIEDMGIEVIIFFTDIATEINIEMQKKNCMIH